MQRTLKCLMVVCISLMSLSLNMPAQSSNTECPTVMVDCPTQLIRPDEPFTVSARINGADPNLGLNYQWSVVGGTIISGQGTPSITVKSSRPDCQALTATVEVSGLNPSCQDSASCSMIPGSPPVSRKFDEYSDISFDDEKGHLERFAAQLKNEPDSQGYIVFSGGVRANDRASQRQAKRARNYLINTNGIEAARIFAVKGSAHDAITIELWIAPQGAPAPPDFVSTLPPCPRNKGY